MEPRERVLGQIAQQEGEDRDVVTVDFGDLVRKLILFERVILESNRLLEFPLLIRKFGYGGVKELLESERLRIRTQAEAFGHVEPEQKAIGQHEIVWFTVNDMKKWNHEWLQPINDVPGLNARQAQKLRGLVGSCIVTPPANKGKAAMSQFTADLAENSPLARRSVAIWASKELSLPIGVNDFDLRVEHVGERTFHSDTDLGDRFGLDDLRAHEIVSKGLLGVAVLNQRIEMMDRYKCVTGFQAGELPLFEERLSLLARQLDPDVHEDRFERVLEIADLPDVDPSPDTQDVDLARLVELLGSDELREFRSWLRSLDSLDDAEVEHQISRLKDTVKAAVHSSIAHGVRFGATAGLSIVVPPLGMALGAIDSVLLDRVVGQPGPTAFLSRLYPTIFQQ